MQGVLAGMRIIDLAHGIPGPVAALQLAEAGAEVIKIEPPGGDPERGQPGFHVWNRGKKSVLLDLATECGRSDLHRLLASADVLIHDLAPTRAAALGIASGQCAARHPDLIVSAVTGWPGNHPDRERPAHESLVLARLGLLDEQPGHRPGPVFIRLPFASWMTAWLCAIGVLARLISRGRGGNAGQADTSLAQGALAPMTMHWTRAATPTANFAKGLSKQVAIAIHRCADGRWIHVHYSPDKTPLMAAALAKLGPEGVAAANARWGQNHTAPNFGANREIIATRPSQEWLEHFWAHDIAAQPAAPFGEIHFDAQARANDYIVPVSDPLFGDTLQPGAPYAGVPRAPVGALHAAGSDTADVMSSIIARPSRPRNLEPAKPPLHGLKVVDFGAYLAGPFGTMLLADLGADVIKVEPVGGDALRYIERGFCGAQRGKRSLALQLGDPRARIALEALVRWADIAHHNVRMPSARKLGIDPPSLASINPDIITCHVSSYGNRGPRADWPGYDQMFQAACGWEVENGGEGNPPMWLRFGITDHYGALTSVLALLLAVYHGDRTGERLAVSASLLGGSIWTTSEALVRPDGGVEGFARLDHDQTGVSATHRLYRCADGWIAIAALAPAETAAFRLACGTDPAAFMQTQSMANLTALLGEANVPAEAVRTGQEQAFLDSSDNHAARLVAAFEHTAYGHLEQIGTFWDFGELPLCLERPPPTIGQHSIEVLAELGFTGTQIAELEDAGITIVTREPGMDPARNKRRSGSA